MRVGLKRIHSRDNPQVKMLARFAASARERRLASATLIEGERLVRAVLDAGCTAEILFASESAFTRPEVRTLLETAPAKSRLVLADSLVERISQLVSAAGVAALVRTPEPPAPPQPLGDSIFIEGIQDPGNLGSILRSAAAAGVRHLFLSPASVFAWSPKVVRAAMGAHFRLEIFENQIFEKALAGFRGCIVATDPHAARPLYALDLRGPIAWLFGNEGTGLSERALSLASDRVRIPMPGAAESLNLAAAVAVCLFEQVRQRTAGSL